MVGVNRNGCSIKHCPTQCFEILLWLMLHICNIANFARVMEIKCNNKTFFKHYCISSDANGNKLCFSREHGK